MNSQLRASVLGVCLLFSVGGLASQAQTRIDPSLPEAPLPHQRSLFLFPGYDTVPGDTAVPPLRVHQKFELAFRTTTDLSSPIRAGITSGFEHAVGIGPFYGPGGNGFAQLYGYNAANLASSFLFTDAVIPSLAHQDPRYFCKGSGSAKSRIWWALRSEFVAYSDSGRPMANYGSMVGLGMSALLSDAYLPSHNVSVGKTFEGYGIKLSIGWGLNLVHEFRGAERIRKIIQQQTDKITQPKNPSAL